MGGVVTVANIIEAGKEIADPIMETKILDVFQALIIKAKMDASNYEPDPILAKIKSVAEVALTTHTPWGLSRLTSRQLRRMRMMTRSRSGGPIPNQRLKMPLPRPRVSCILLFCLFT